MVRHSLDYLKTVVQKSPNTPPPPLADSLVLLFFWFSLLLLSGLGNLYHLPVRDLSLYVAWGMGGLSAAAALVALFAAKKRNPALVLFLSYTMLIVLPAILVVPRASERVILLDLYFILLVTAPAFLGIWSWQLQAVAGALAATAVAELSLPVASRVAVHSIVLVTLAAVFSCLVLLLRSRRAVQGTIELERMGREAILKAGRELLPQQVWNVILLQAGLILVLLFLDVSFWGDSLSQPVLAKMYAFIVLIFGSLLIKAARQEQVGGAVALITILVGVVLAISRVGYVDLHNPAAAIPLVYLAFVMTALPWSLSLHITVVWVLIAADILIKAFGGIVWFGEGIDRLGVALLTYQGETALLAIGSLGSVLAARLLQHHRVSNVAEFRRVFGRESSTAVEQEESERVALRSIARDALEPERRQRLIAGLLLLGVLSCIVSSQLLVSIAVDRPGALIGTWIAFFTLWVSVVHLERRQEATEYFWLLGAVVHLLLFLWPCVLLLVAKDAGLLWLFWPCGLILGVGLVPWSIRELLPLLLVVGIAGVEIVYQLDLELLGVSVFVSGLLLAVLFSVQGNRWLKERHFLLALPRALESCRDSKQTVRVLADFMMQVFESQSAFSSSSKGELEILRGGTCIELEEEQWPLRTLANSFPAVHSEAGSVRTKIGNWLPGQFNFFDQRFGVVAPSHGLLVELHSGGDEETDLEPACVFIVTRFPLFEVTRSNEIRTVSALATIAASRLRLLYEEEQAAQRTEQYEQRALEREYELGAIVHDINNTVQDMTLLCESILEDSLPDALHGEGSAKEREAELSTQIRRIADVARSVATVVSDAKRKRELERMSDLSPRELVEVSGVLDDILIFASIRAERKRIQVERTSPSPQKAWVRVSVREHLETILRNLLNNAITYSDPGSIVSVELELDADWVRIHVRDNGPGLRENERESIFLSGFRGRSSTGVPGGLGLGLAESRRVAESAGGSLEAFSEGEGHGSTFTVVLPRQATPRQQVDGEQWALVVDDQPALAEFYCRLSKALHLTPESASSVDEALSIIDNRGQPTFVITDIHLGASNGLELVRQLRAEYGNSLPILVVSGLTDDYIADKARAAGATDFVAKPVGRRALFARIQSLLPNFGL